MAHDPATGGAVEQYLQKHLFGGYVARAEVITVGTASVQVLPNDPERIGAVIVNTSSVQITLGLEPGVVAGQGIILADLGVTMMLTYIEDGILSAWEWHAIAPSAANNLYVVQLKRERAD